MKIFGTDGIRAIAGEFPLTAEGVCRLGYSAGIILQKKDPTAPAKFVIGKDTRQSGNWIEKALSDGFCLSGCQVFSCGVIPTSAIAAFLQTEQPARALWRGKKFLAGVVISASHNTAAFNGIKFFSSKGKKIPDAWETEIENLFFKKNEIGKKTARQRLNSHKKFHKPIELKVLSQSGSRYTEFLKNALPPSFSFRGLRWVLDCANGAASKVAPALFKSFGAKIIAMHNHPNGRNINLNCGALYPQSLQRAVVKSKAFGGCAFDGDADRVQFVDEKGRLMNGDILIALAAEAMKKNHELKKNCVVTTVMANLGFFQRMKKLGIGVVTTEVGDRAVSQAMETHQASLGGEQSGHIIFRKILPTGDGLLTALKILEIVIESGKKLSFFTESFPEYPQVLVNLKVREKVPIENLPQLQNAMRAAESQLDGNGRILVRYSGTEPLLRIMAQGNSRPQIQRAAQGIAAVAKRVLRW